MGNYVGITETQYTKAQKAKAEKPKAKAEAPKAKKTAKKED